MSSTSIGIRIPANLYQRLESYTAQTRLTKTEVMLNALAQYLSAGEEIPLSQRMAALEAQMLELKGLVNSSIASDS